MTGPGQGFGPPFYTALSVYATVEDFNRIGQEMKYLPVFFTRQLYCVPPNSNLLAPDLTPAAPFRNRADRCPPSVAGWELYLSPEDVTRGNRPVATKLTGENSVVICFVPFQVYGGFLKAGAFTMTQLAEAPGVRWGHAYNFSMYWQFRPNTNNINGQEFIANGITLDGETFSLHLRSRFTPDATGTGSYPVMDLKFTPITSESSLGSASAPNMAPLTPAPPNRLGW